jgi:Fe-S cluster assembly protein SufD
MGSVEEVAAGVIEPAEAKSASEQAAGAGQFAELFAERFSTADASDMGGMRRDSLARFLERGLPTAREEAWRFTNVAAVGRTRWLLAAPEATVDAGALAAHLYDGCCPLVVVNGRFRRDLSRLPVGCQVLSSREAQGAASSELAAALLDPLGQLASPSEHRFAALNSALFDDVLVLDVPERAVIEEPIQVLFLTVCNEQPRATFPRLLVRAGRSSEVTVVERYSTLGGGPALTCAVGELFVGENATLHYYREVRESCETLHLAVQQTRLERAAVLDSQSILYGGRLVRCEIGAFLAGEGADATLDGLYVGGGRQHLDTHLRVDHASPRCTSHELYKGVLTDRARAVFNGLLHVHKVAQKTDAKQTNRNLLLSDEALVNSNPQLEIFADDVRCTHGSTTGQLDRDALFYLRSRGLSATAARSILTFAFVGELLEKLTVPALRRSLVEDLAQRLSAGEVDLAGLLPSEP